MPHRPASPEKELVTGSRFKPRVFLHFLPSHPFLYKLLTYPFLFLFLSGTEHPLFNCLLIKQALNKYIPRKRGLCNIAPSQVIIKHRSQQLSKSGNKEGVGRTAILPVICLGRDWHPHKFQLQYYSLGNFFPIKKRVSCRVIIITLVSVCKTVRYGERDWRGRGLLGAYPSIPSPHRSKNNSSAPTPASIPPCPCPRSSLIL